MKSVLSFTVLIFSLIVVSYASLKVPMYNTNTGKSVGYIIAQNTQYGLLLTPHLHDLPPGVHGFHVHTDPSCANHAMAAGGHLDPMKTQKHLGPFDTRGHLGDLPVLIVNKQGDATKPVLAPKLTEKLIKDHALMIHAGGDNYSDQPAKLGGGGKRIACGVIAAKTAKNPVLHY